MMHTRRLSLRFMAAAAGAWAISGCSAPPTVAQNKGPWSELQLQVLHEYGFEQTDDGWELQLIDKLLFDVDSDRIEADRRASIERMGRALASAGLDRLRVEGHTDDMGTVAYNNRLSLRRAEAVAQVLSETGIPMDRITVQGFGSTRPLATGTGRGSRRENRRVAIVIPTPQP